MLDALTELCCSPIWFSSDYIDSWIVSDFRRKPLLNESKPPSFRYVICEPHATPALC